MVAVAVIAENATIEPDHGTCDGDRDGETSHAALTAILRFESLRKNGKTRSLDMAYVVRCTLSRQLAVAHVESTQSMLDYALPAYGYDASAHLARRCRCPR